MKMGTFNILACVMAVVLLGSLRAGEADGANRRQVAGTPGGVAGLLLKNADTLGLSADQKAKLEDMVKGPLAVLTEEQKKKAVEIVKAARPPAGNGEGKLMKKKDASEGEKKPEETKPEEKKPE